MWRVILIWSDHCKSHRRAPGVFGAVADMALICPCALFQQCPHSICPTESVVFMLAPPCMSRLSLHGSAEPELCSNRAPGRLVPDLLLDRQAVLKTATKLNEVANKPSCVCFHCGHSSIGPCVSADLPCSVQGFALLSGEKSARKKKRQHALFFLKSLQCVLE